MSSELQAGSGMLVDVELQIDAISDAFGFCAGIEKYYQYRALYKFEMNGMNGFTKTQEEKAFELTGLSRLE